ncbi:hypothetical protein GCM10022255_098520 [Dactylosporangium darangshiense]|uniref:HIT domain-containing protein n=1 Tax=Dactylosporangium darangshiense TaxID=579108 RepID=A0ABP8DR99_9ACTN
MAQPDGPCPFCDKVIAGRNRTAFDVPLADLGAFLLAPALGMFVPGYLLLVARDHVPSFAHLGAEGLAAVEAWRRRRLPGLGERFGEYFAFEHGMGAPADGRTGACLDHAHLHLVPSAAGAKVIADALPWEEIPSYEALADARGVRYSYFGRGDRHLVVRDVDLPSQWVRRQTACALGLDTWDWAAYAGELELAVTLAKVEGHELGSAAPSSPTLHPTLKSTHLVS